MKCVHVHFAMYRAINSENQNRSIQLKSPEVRPASGVLTKSRCCRSLENAKVKGRILFSHLNASEILPRMTNIYLHVLSVAHKLSSCITRISNCSLSHGAQSQFLTSKNTRSLYNQLPPHTGNINIQLFHASAGNSAKYFPRGAGTDLTGYCPRRSRGQ